MSANGHPNGRDRDGTPAPGLADRLPPQNLEAERGVLGSVLLDNDVLDEVAGELAPEDFYRDAHAVLYRRILAMRAAGLPVDALTLSEALRTAAVGRLTELGLVGGEDYLAEVIGSVPHAVNGRYYAQIVRQKAVARAMIEGANETLREGYSDAFTAAELVAHAEGRLAAVTDAAPGRRARQVGPALDEVIRRIGSRTGGVGGLPTPWPELDRLTDGFQPEQLVVLAARPSMGKSTAAMNMAAHAALVAAVPVLFASIEMGELELAERLLCGVAEVDNHRLRNPAQLDARDLGAMGAAEAALRAAPLSILDDPAADVARIAAEARRMKRRGGLGLVVVDYLQLIDAPDDRQGRKSRQDEVAAISRRLKGLARELRVPVVALSQLNRDCEKRNDRRPLMADLRESGAIEQDADLVVLMHRPSYYEPNDQPGVAEMIVAKNRNGPTGVVKLTWRPHVYRVDDPAYYPPPAPRAPADDVLEEPVPRPRGRAYADDLEPAPDDGE